MNKIIAIFNNDITPAAFINVDQAGELTFDFISMQPDALQDFRDYLKQNEPRQLKRIEHNLVLVSIKKDSPEYFDAIISELEIRGFVAKPIQAVLKDHVIKLCKMGTAESRGKVLANIFNLTEEEAAEVGNVLKEALVD
jgi:hypothetical protein